MIPKHVLNAIFTWVKGNPEEFLEWEQAYKEAEKLTRSRITYLLRRLSPPTYFDFYYREEKREILLIKVKAKNSKIYLSGIDGNKGEWRQFRLDRISRFPKIKTIQELWNNEILRRKLRREQIDPSYLPKKVDIASLPFVSLFLGPQN